VIAAATVCPCLLWTELRPLESLVFLLLTLEDPQGLEDLTMTQGTLYLVATPIGNLEDITLRALRLLKQADLIACEDTRHTAKLLAYYGIAVPKESYHEHNEASRTPHLLEILRSGRSIALVTDAGTPLVSDPGFTLVSECIRAGISVVPVPGPSAVIAALSASGLPCDSFCFGGFLPPKSSQRRQRLKELSNLECTLVLYEAPHRILASLSDMIEILGMRTACLARELTKIHEEFIHGNLVEIHATLLERPSIPGEITIIIGKGDAKRQANSYPASIRQHLEREASRTGVPEKEALRAVARQRGISRRDAYRLLLEEKNSGSE
jgi:16S rRNA (cytidine1402-2'-O)-methyltransferase